MQKKISTFKKIDIKKGENSRVPRFDKICGKLAQFWKYLTIYKIKF